MIKYCLFGSCDLYLLVFENSKCELIEIENKTNECVNLVFWSTASSTCIILDIHFKFFFSSLCIQIHVNTG